MSAKPPSRPARWRGAQARVGGDDEHRLAAGDERVDRAGDAAAAAVADARRRRGAAGAGAGSGRVELGERGLEARRSGSPTSSIAAGLARARAAQHEARLDRAAATR